MAAGFSIIHSLKLPRGDFRSAILIITIGTLTVLVAFIRMIVLIVRMTKTDERYNNIYTEAELPANFDQHISVAVQESVVGYNEIEAILACIAACLPGIRVLFRRRAMESGRRLTFKDYADASCCGSFANSPHTSCCSSIMSTPQPSPPTSPPMVFEKRMKGEEIV
jgi:hypothetical protein